MFRSLFNRITGASLRYKWGTILLTILVFTVGLVALTQFNRELIPPIEFPQTVLIALKPGEDGEVMLSEVTIPLEDAVAGIDGVVNVESTTSSGLSLVIVMSEFGMDQEAIRSEIQDSIDALELPAGVQAPELLTFSLSDLPIVSSSVSSPDLNISEIKALVEDEILPQLEVIKGVAAVEVSGGQILPTEPPATPEVTEEPTQVPTPEPTATSEPTPEPSSTPILPSPEATDAVVEPLPLPESWIQAAAAQGITLLTTANLDPQIVTAIASLAPQLLADLTPEMLLAMPQEVLAVLPVDYLAGLDPELQAQLATLIAPMETELQPVPLPDSWIQAAASQGITIETTADLEPELMSGIATFAPQLLADLTGEMLLAMPVEVLAALPVEYISALDPQLQSQLAERLAQNPAPEAAQPATGELPPAWQAAGQSQSIELVVPEDVTPEIIQGVTSVAPQLLDALTPDNLRRFSPEVLGWLPEEYLASLDPELRTELDELAQPVGGVGALAAQAVIQAEEVSAGAPQLSGAWRQPPPKDTPAVMPAFETAADLMTSGFTDSAASLLNLLVNSAGEQATQLIADLTPDVIAWLTDNESDFLANLNPAVLRLFSAEVLSALPEEFLASLQPQLRAELEGIAAGTLEAFIPTDTINRVNGNPSLLLSIYKDGEANTVSVSHEIFDKMEEFEADYPGLSFDLVFEQSSFIEESINGVTREGALGALFAVMVILFFLSGSVDRRYKLNWRSTLVAAVSIPMSIMMAFALLKWLPPVADLALTPLADATAGIPIIGAIVAIIHHLFPIGLTLNIMTLAGMTVAIGRVVDDSIVVLENIYRHIQRGEDQRKSVLIGTRDVSIAIFASTLTTVVVFLPIGLMGGLVGEFFLPFGIAVTYALVSSFIVAITIVPLLAFLLIRKENLPTEKETTLQRWYTPILKWSLGKRLLTIAIATLLLLGSMYLFSGQPRAFLPDFGEPRISVSVNLPTGTTMSETNDTLIAFENKLSKFEDCCVVQSEVGISGGMASRFMGGGINQAGASLSMGVDKAQDLDSLTAEVRKLAEEHFGLEYVTVTGGALTSSAFGSFGLVAFGDMQKLTEFNDQALGALELVDGLTNISSNLTETDTILRVNRQSAVRYSGELETEDSLGVTSLAKTALEEIAPAGITISEGFETRAQTEGFRESVSSILVAIVAVYIVMVFTFRSFVHPFTILFSLPLAIIGVSLALWITGSVLGISALVGVMMLVGIVVTNAIVLLDRVQVNRKERGMEIREALVEGGRTRLRPILMTAIATMLALLPLALGLTEGALIASELAIVVIGGLFTSTLLTLLVVPVMYSILDPLSRSRRAAPAAKSDDE